MAFETYIGIDYSGAGTASSGQSGLQVCRATAGEEPRKVNPSGRKRWTRDLLADWLSEQLTSGRVAVGLDHGFSLTASYFEANALRTWSEFLEHLAPAWTLSGALTVGKRLRGYAKQLRRECPLRRTERWTASARSVFDFRGQGSVAFSTHAGIPYLHRLRGEHGQRVHVWPFDGWNLPANGGSVLFEVYPSLLRRRYDHADTTASTDQKDAWAVARWLSEVDSRDLWGRYLHPPLNEVERRDAALEGWILGVT